MKTKIHAVAGGIGFVMILLFWTSTVSSELFTSHETVATVKALILKGMFILIPAMAIAGGSGMAMAWKRKDALTRAKKTRMPVIALNGLLICPLLTSLCRTQRMASDLRVLASKQWHQPVDQFVR